MNKIIQSTGITELLLGKRDAGKPVEEIKELEYIEKNAEELFNEIVFAKAEYEKEFDKNKDKIPKGIKSKFASNGWLFDKLFTKEDKKGSKIQSPT